MDFRGEGRSYQPSLTEYKRAYHKDITEPQRTLVNFIVIWWHDKILRPSPPREGRKVGGSDPWFLIGLFITFLASKTFSPPARQLMHCPLFFSKIVYGGFGKKPCKVEIESYEHYAFGNSNDLRISRMLKVNVSRYKSQLFIILHLINCFQTMKELFSLEIDFMLENVA